MSTSARIAAIPARTCSNGVFKRAEQVGRPCLLGYIDKCSAPCVGKVDQQAHRQIVDEFCDFMAGDSARFLKRLERDMVQAAAHQDYERAARLRDDIGALTRATEKQAVVLSDGTDADVVAIAEDQLGAKLKELAKGADDRIYVRGSHDVQYGRIAEVMAIITSSGFKRVALVTDPAKN